MKFIKSHAKIPVGCSGPVADPEEERKGWCAGAPRNGLPPKRGFSCRRRKDGVRQAVVPPPFLLPYLFDS